MTTICRSWWGVRNTVARAALALALFAMLLSGADAAPSWPLAPYTYFANSEALEDVLKKFAGGFSLSLQMGPGVNGLVNGRFTAGSPTEFMDKLAGVYGFNWFVYAGTLFVSPANAMVTKTVNVGTGSIAGIRQALDRLGVLDPRFGWGELADQGLALVSGPPAYVDLVERTLKAPPSGGGKQEVAVFRLKFASVNDRVVRYRDQSITTPGLATVLRNLLSGSGPGSGNAALAALASPLRAAVPAFRRDDVEIGRPDAVGGGAGAPYNDVSAGTPMAGGQRSASATIQADPRLNAIIVQDVPERVPVYRDLIAQLDVPSTLIEIEATIVNVNTEAMNELGVNWSATAGKARFDYGMTGLSAADSGSDLPGSGLIGIGVGSVLQARLKALQNDQDAKVLSRPSILTADNIGALVDTSRSFYVKVSAERYATVKEISVGTSLRVTPRYIQSPTGPQVELTIDIEDGNFVVQDKQVDNMPVVSRTSISTLAVVGDGDTLLIGGYNVSEDGNVTSKVPLLGDIPGVGALFSYKQKSSKQWSRLFLIRPRIVEVNGNPLVSAWLTKWGMLRDLSWGENEGWGAIAGMAGAGLRLVDGINTRVVGK